MHFFACQVCDSAQVTLLKNPILPDGLSAFFKKVRAIGEMLWKKQWKTVERLCKKFVSSTLFLCGENFWLKFRFCFLQILIIQRFMCVNTRNSK